jgi:alginate O-acetyltransferase complex protein AlgI
MLFNSLDFLVFFPVVTLIYFLLPHKLRWVHLLAASCYFYMSFIPAYILILGFTISIDYIAGMLIEGSSGRRRRLFLVISLFSNIGVLALFKYADFLIGQGNFILHAVHSAKLLPLQHIILPIGLSFHTFQAMSYTIEIYRGNQRAERHFGLYALYVMFYPQLVAGPIERPSGLLRQLRERHYFNWVALGSGLRLMLWGFFKKLVIADRVSGYVNYAYAHVNHLSSAYVVLAVILFSFQIYCDFSGYSDIAIGAARTMGFSLTTNFNRPYFSTGLREFWTRWHISLSTWFRDYLYIPLGGNRVRHGRKYLNILIVFLLSGLWHGASWNFVVWGAVHGVMMLCVVVYADLRGRRRGDAAGWPGKAAGLVATFSLVTLAWVFFRCVDMGEAMNILGRLAGCSGDPHFEAQISKTTLALSGLFIGVLLWVEAKLSPRLDELQRRMWPDIAFGALTLASILVFGVFTSQPFIYFQF